MRKKYIKIFILFICIILLISSCTVVALKEKNIVSSASSNDEFYFVQITDSHVVDNEDSKNRLKSVIKKITGFNKKPAFVVFTGDLVEWGGDCHSGALNCQTFVDCLYQKEDQLFTDPDYTIPAYTVPGNHDYRNINLLDLSLDNYHEYIDNRHVDQDDKYVVKYGSLSLFFLNSGHDYLEGHWTCVLGDGLYDKDIEWLETSLINCETSRKIVLMHHPAVNNEFINEICKDVIARNREEFINLCDKYNVELVLCGHTHRSIVLDSEYVTYAPNLLPLNCSNHPPLHVQTDDCKQGVHYRNISMVNGHVWLQETKTVKDKSDKDKHMPFVKMYLWNIFSKLNNLKSLLLK